MQSIDIEADTENTHGDPAVAIGVILRNLRKQQNTTGTHTATKLGVSQARISRIEHGLPPFRKRQVYELLNILDAPQTIRQQVEVLINKQHHDNQVRGIYSFSNHVAQSSDIAWTYEKAAKEIFIFTSNVPPALLQTIAFRESLLKKHGIADDELFQEMRHTEKRQSTLWDKSKRLRFVLHESALYTLITDVQQHLDQLDRLERMAGLTSLKIGVIHYRAGVSVTPPLDFALYDSTSVSYDIGSQDVTITDSERVLHFTKLSRELSSRASYGREAIVLIRNAIDYFSN